jgi:hypothetical protein
MKIGILLTPFKEEQIQKQEYVEKANRDWLTNLSRKDTIVIKNKEYTTDDISIFKYLKAKYHNKKEKHEFIAIPGDSENLKSQIESCDIVFLLIFDVLEAFHTHSEYNFSNIKKIFKLPNVFPPFPYQDLINKKNKYYKFLQEKSINVLPFLYISAGEIRNDMKSCIDKIKAMELGDDRKFIGKPIFGQESVDFEVFSKNTKKYRIEKYLDRIKNMYPGCIFQPFKRGYDRFGEYRVFFIGDSIEYCVRTKTVNDEFQYEVVFSRNTSLKDKSLQFAKNVNINVVKNIFKFCKSIFDKLPVFTCFGNDIPKLLTRMDISCCHNNSYFVAEIEFVPSLYSDRVDNLFIDGKLGEQIKYIIDQVELAKKKKKSKTDQNISFGVRGL